MKSNKRHVFALAVISLIGSGASTQAALTIGDIVSVNFGQTTSISVSGAALIGTSGDTWNNIKSDLGSNVSSIGTVGLVDTSNTASGASLSVSDGQFNGSFTSSTNLDVYEGNIFRTTGTSTITLTGLGANTYIDLYIYVGAGHTAGEGGTFTFASTPKTATDEDAVETAYTEGVNYVKFTDLQADGSGTITGSWSAASGQTYSSFAGLQFEVVPEPSTALLGGLGMLVLLRRRRA